MSEATSAESSFVPFAKKEVEQSLPARFRKIVGRFGEETALVCGGRCMTYDALDKASNQVARAILEHIGGGEAPVPLILDHGLLPVIALWGVLKSGHGYVALRPGDPPQRLRNTLKDLQASLVLTDHTHRDLVANVATGDCEQLDVGETVQSPTGANDVPISPDGIAAIFYTSGSSGEPKGVVHTHRSLLHMAWRDSHYYRFGSTDHYFDPFACGFIASASALFNALLNGASLHLYNAQEIAADRLARSIIRDGITFLHPTLSLLRQLLDTLESSRELSRADWRLRLLALSGESVYAPDVQRFIRAMPLAVRVLHRFSCSETGPVAYFEVDTQTLGANVIPVGFATPDTEILLLDDDGRSVSPGQIGELAIKSRYLAAGYWQRPDLTQAKFLPDPNGGDQRLYLTGDLGRQRPDGCLEHLGRKDFQAKVRGYTVAPAAIEASLHKLAEVKEALVVARENRAGYTRLIAYIVPSEKAAPSVAFLRRSLARTLPDYMIPSTFITLAHLPLTATGKIDRGSLPSPGSGRPSLDTPFVAPRTLTEERLAGIWSDVLGVENLGVADNFFALGGHSLLATRVISRVRQAFEIDVPLRIFVDVATIAGLADLLDTMHWVNKISREPPLSGDDGMEETLL